MISYLSYLLIDFLFLRLLDAEETFKYDQFKRFYSEILYRWHLTTQRAEVVKYMTEQPEKPKGLGIENTQTFTTLTSFFSFLHHRYFVFSSQKESLVSVLSSSLENSGDS